MAENSRLAELIAKRDDAHTRRDRPLEAGVGVSGPKRPVSGVISEVNA